MNTITRRLLLAASFGAAALFALPSVGTGFSTIGGSLGISTAGNGYQRDVRVFNNATDPTANDNVAANADYPNALGAALAAWKAARQWNSDQGGQRNFDADWQGQTTSTGNSNANTISWGDPGGCGGGTLAYMDPGFSPGISNGWQIRVCESGITWNDGPGGINFAHYDIQAVLTHEYGHALGLGHTNVGCTSCNETTMCPASCNGNTSQRSIEPDDRAGLESIYGTIAANKPEITALSGSLTVGQTLTIHGTDFPSPVNVKFSANTTQNTGSIPGTVFNVTPTSSTQLSVTIPSGAIDGNVLLWSPTLGRLSNPFPIDIGAVPPGPPFIANADPDELPAANPGIVTLSGSMFTGVTQVNFGSTTITPPTMTVVDDTTITFAAPAPTALGPVSITVDAPLGTSNAIVVDFVVTEPLSLFAPPFILNTQPATWTWGGKVNQQVFMLFNSTGTSVPYKGTQLLVWDVLLPFPNTDAMGLGSLPVPAITGIPSGTTLHAQILTVDPGNPGFATLELSNITQSLCLF